MIAFEKEPLKSFIERKDGQPIMKPVQAKPKGKSDAEVIVFSLIVAMFLIGFIFYSGDVSKFQINIFGSGLNNSGALSGLSRFITGHAVYKEVTEIAYVYASFNESTYFRLTIPGNITSLRMTGTLIGNGTAKIYVNGKSVLDSNDLKDKSGNQITGFVISENDLGSAANDRAPNQEIINSTPEPVPDTYEPILNDTAGADIQEPINASQPYNAADILSNTTGQDLIEIPLDELPESNATTEVNITTNFTELNITVNETHINETMNLTLPEINITINETELNNSEFNLTANNTLFNETLVNETLVNESVYNETIPVAYATISGETLSLENYCLDTCRLNIDGNITIYIELHNSAINISTFSYSRFVTDIITETNATGLDNSSKGFLSLAPDLENYTGRLSQKGMKIVNLENNSASTYRIKVGRDDTDFAEMTISTQDDDFGFIQTNDSRISAQAFLLGSNETDVKVSLKAKNAGSIFRCIQLEESTCKRWQKTKISVAKKGDSVEFSPDEPGLYSAGNPIKKASGYIEASSVYYNSNCDGCEKFSDCSAKQFCVLQNGYNNQEFIGQLGFDILGIDPKFKSAEVCSYLYYNSSQPVMNYIRYGAESFCSDIRLNNISSSLVSSLLVDSNNGWVCIDATEIVREATDNDYSDVFINWLGQDVNGESFPMDCYYGFAGLNNCGGENPSGAQDCRPYLRLNYK